MYNRGGNDVYQFHQVMEKTLQGRHGIDVCHE
jgi:hypothetical protein